MTEAELDQLLEHLRAGRAMPALLALRLATGATLLQGKVALDALQAACARSGTEPLVRAVLAQARGPDAAAAEAALAGQLGTEPASAIATLFRMERPRPALAPVEQKRLSEELLDACDAGDRTAVCRLLEAGAPIDGYAGLPALPLERAVERGDRAVVELLLEHGAHPELEAVDRPSPLLRALARGDLDLAQLLLDRGALGPVHPARAAEPTAVRTHIGGPLDSTPLLRALARRDPGLAQWLRARDVSDAVDPPLEAAQAAMRALVGGPVDAAPLLREMLRRGAQPGALDLRLAIDRGHAQMIDVLLEAGVPLDGVREGLSPLASACTVGPAALVERLLERGALLNAVPYDMASALHCAATSDRDAREKVRALVTRGADTSRRNRAGQTAAEAARALGRTELADELEQLALQAGPAWMRAARARGLGLIWLVRGKAEGFAFNPHDLERPILFGGDYDGAWPLTALEAFHALPHVVEDTPMLAPVRPFLPFVEKLARGEDFTLAEVEAACGPLAPSRNRGH